MQNVLKFEELIQAICNETKPKGKMPIMESGYVFPLALERLMRGDSYQEVLGKLAVKKQSVCEATIKRFHQRYASVIDPVRRIGILIKDGRMKPTEMLFIEYPSGELNVRKLEENDLKIKDWDDEFTRYAKMNAVESLRQKLPRSVREQEEMRKEGSYVHLTGREFKSGRMTLLDYRLKQNKEQKTEKPEMRKNSK